MLINIWYSNSLSRKNCNKIVFVQMCLWKTISKKWFCMNKNFTTKILKMKGGKLWYEKWFPISIPTKKQFPIKISDGKFFNENLGNYFACIKIFARNFINKLWKISIKKCLLNCIWREKHYTITYFLPEIF